MDSRSLVRVLLIDDDEEDYLITRSSLGDIKKTQYEVDWAESYEEGLEKMRARQHDIYLLDYRLGPDSGLDLMKQALAEGIFAPMILLTGQGDQALDEEASQLGAADYLVKGSFDHATLDRSIRYSLRHFGMLEQVRQLHEGAERQVQARTADLSKAIQELKAANIAIAESQRLLQAVAHNFPNGAISVLDENWNYVFIDGQNLGDFAAGREEYLNKNIRNFLTPEEYSELEPRLRAAFHGEADSLELRLDDRAYKCYIVPLPDLEDRVLRVMLVNQDITEQQKAEQNIREALQKERQLSELKSRFVSMASHEFRTPLSTILSSVSLIARYHDPADMEKRNKHIQRIQSSVKHLTDTLNDFLSIGKLEEGIISINPSLFNLNELAEDVIEEIQVLKKNGQQIHYTHYGISDSVILDKQLVRNILINLLSNALKYSPEEAAVQLEMTVQEDHLAISVSDAGIGIPEEDQKHIFSTFYRANNVNNIQGTGLGLNIVKRYLDMMGGSISFTSEMNKGTTFTVNIPYLKLDPHAEDTPDRR